MKEKYKILVAFILGILVSTIGVYAAEEIVLKSKEVEYDNTSSHSKTNNVQDAIDELYTKSGYHKEIWKDPVLNGADPVLEIEGSTKKLIPITIEDDGTVHYANLYSEWYDYSKKKWANAVILVDNPKNGGEENYTYKTGDIIKEEDIESYFVWIPRYSYKIWDLGDYDDAPRLSNVLTDTNYASSPQNAFNKPRIIDIVFESKEKAKSGYSNGVVNSNIKVGDYLTHPAFTLGDKELNGIWVGKFETGYNQNGENGNPITVDKSWTKANAQKEGEASNRIIVKPNVYSWRNNTVQNFFLSSFNYARGLESHMMKNTEWGAVAYLSHSVYGIGGAVNINNNKNYITGYGAAAGTNQDIVPGENEEVMPKENTDVTQSYNTPSGYLASTTGNITGVYDMSGGTMEYMASYLQGYVGDSGFSDNDLTVTYKDYVDTYVSDGSYRSYYSRILGDATGELGPFYQYYDADGTSGAGGTQGTLRYHSSWYTDDAYFVDSRDGSWFIRGGIYSYGSLAGQFYFTRTGGGIFGSHGTRLVLAIK